MRLLWVRLGRRKSEVLTEVERFKPHLAIDKNNLDDCLIEQPEVYYHVSEALVKATAERDAIKLQLEEATAAEDQNIRTVAVRMGEKLTEASIQNKLTLVPAVKVLADKLVKQSGKVGELAALKEAFSQRSFMLRELVALFIAQRHDLAMSNGSNQSRTTLAETNRNEAGKIRRQRLLKE